MESSESSNKICNSEVLSATTVCDEDNLVWPKLELPALESKESESFPVLTPNLSVEQDLPVNSVRSFSCTSAVSDSVELTLLGDSKSNELSNTNSASSLHLIDSQKKWVKTATFLETLGEESQYQKDWIQRCTSLDTIMPSPLKKITVQSTPRRAILSPETSSYGFCTVPSLPLKRETPTAVICEPALPDRVFVSEKGKTVKIVRIQDFPKERRAVNEKSPIKKLKIINGPKSEERTENKQLKVSPEIKKRSVNPSKKSPIPAIKSCHSLVQKTEIPARLGCQKKQSPSKVVIKNLAKSPPKLNKKNVPIIKPTTEVKQGGLESEIKEGNNIIEMKLKPVKSKGAIGKNEVAKSQKSVEHDDNIKALILKVDLLKEKALEQEENHTEVKKKTSQTVEAVGKTLTSLIVEASEPEMLEKETGPPRKLSNADRGINRNTLIAKKQLEKTSNNKQTYLDIQEKKKRLEKLRETQLKLLKTCKKKSIGSVLEDRPQWVGIIEDFSEKPKKVHNSSSNTTNFKECRGNVGRPNKNIQKEATNKNTCMKNMPGKSKEQQNKMVQNVIKAGIKSDVEKVRPLEIPANLSLQTSNVNGLNKFVSEQVVFCPAATPSLEPNIDNEQSVIHSDQADIVKELSVQIQVLEENLQGLQKRSTTSPDVKKLDVGTQISELENATENLLSDLSPGPQPTQHKFSPFFNLGSSQKRASFLDPRITLRKPQSGNVQSYKFSVDECQIGFKGNDPPQNTDPNNVSGGSYKGLDGSHLQVPPYNIITAVKRKLIYCNGLHEKCLQKQFSEAPIKTHDTLQDLHSPSESQKTTNLSVHFPGSPGNSSKSLEPLNVEELKLDLPPSSSESCRKSPALSGVVSTPDHNFKSVVSSLSLIRRTENSAGESAKAKTISKDIFFEQDALIDLEVLSVNREFKNAIFESPKSDSTLKNISDVELEQKSHFSLLTGKSEGFSSSKSPLSPSMQIVKDDVVDNLSSNKSDTTISESLSADPLRLPQSFGNLSLVSEKLSTRTKSPSSAPSASVSLKVSATTKRKHQESRSADKSSISEEIDKLSRPSSNSVIVSGQSTKEPYKDGSGSIRNRFLGELNRLEALDRSLDTAIDRNKLLAADNIISSNIQSKESEMYSLTELYERIKAEGSSEECSEISRSSQRGASSDLIYSQKFKQGAMIEMPALLDSDFAKNSLFMLAELIKDEALRTKREANFLKQREKVLFDRTKAEMAWLEIQRRSEKAKGNDEEMRNIKKRQRGLILKHQQEKEEIQRLIRAAKTNSRKRRLFLLQQYQFVKDQLFLEQTTLNKGEKALKTFGNPSVSTSTSPEREVFKDSSGHKSRHNFEKRAREFEESETSLHTRHRNVEAMLGKTKKNEMSERKLKEMEKLTYRPVPQGLHLKFTDRGTSPIRISSEPELSSQIETVQSEASISSAPEEILSQPATVISHSETESKAIDAYSDNFEPTSVISERMSSRPVVEFDKVTPWDERKSRKSMVTIKIPLTPRLMKTKRRHSSGSDESNHFSQNETLSEQSDTEVRVAALQQQLRQRKTELERLKKEHNRTRRESLRAKEQSLVTQIHAYDTYIAEVKAKIQKELESSNTHIVKPQIKQPKVVERRKSDLFLQERKKDDSESSSIETVQSPKQKTDSQDTASVSEEIEHESSENTESVKTLMESSALGSKGTLEEIPSDSRNDEKLEVEGGNELKTIDDVSESKDLLPGTGLESNGSSTQSNEKTASEANASGLESARLNTLDLSVNDPLPSKLGSSSAVEEESEILYPDRIEEQLQVSTPASESSEPQFENSNKESSNAFKVDNNSETIEKLGDESEQSFYSTSFESFKNESPIETEKVSGNDLSICESNSLGTQNLPNLILPTSPSSHLEEQSLKSSLDESECEVKSDYIEETKGSTKEALHLNNETYDNQSDSINRTEQLVTQKEADVDLSTKDVTFNESISKMEEDGSDTISETSNIDSLEEKQADFPKIVDNETELRKLNWSNGQREVQANRIADEIMLNILHESFEMSEKLWRANLEEYDKVTEETPLLKALQEENEKNRNLTIKQKAYRNVNIIAEEIFKKYLEEATNTIFSAYLKRRGVDSYKELPVNENELEYSLEPDTLAKKKVGENEGFWLGEAITSRTSKEAEELRLQQLQIEQEIEELEQATQVPYYYLREIPNKPPPPYTPPKQVSPSPEEVVSRVSQAISIIWDMCMEGTDVESLDVPPQFLANVQDETYKEFMFDVAKEIYCQARPKKEDKHVTPWEKPNSIKRLLPNIKTREDMLKHAERQTKIIFGFEPKAQKENLIIRWSQKKRDNVDELLIREGQEGESEWTDYSVEENIVKNEITEFIINQVLDDAVVSIASAFENKFKEEIS